MSRGGPKSLNVLVDHNQPTNVRGLSCLGAALHRHRSSAKSLLQVLQYVWFYHSTCHTGQARYDSLERYSAEARIHAQITPMLQYTLTIISGRNSIDDDDDDHAILGFSSCCKCGLAVSGVRAVA